jgi:2-C-methyl-D-erythritol 2,4-cyclodiphosphate synthase/2-C-methyl-D-erythritol 4-phosphate cytidylyltransferase
MVSAIITCAGKGVRAGFENNKLLQKIGDKTVLETTYDAFFSTGFFDEIIVTASETEIEIFKSLLKNAVIVKGGKTRFLSVKNALEKVNGDIVLVHDGARPFIDKETIKNCIDTAIKHGSAITAVSSTDTVAKTKNNEKISCVLGKENIYKIQTPQGFNTKALKKAFNKAKGDNFPDESSVYSKYIAKPYIVIGNESNKKLTFKEDFFETIPYLFGTGFDCHKLVENRKLILGGVEIPHIKGLLGHSDADVLTHAIMDAILASLSLRDIGYHFPDNDESYKNANSMLLLEKVLLMVKDKGYKVCQVTASIMAEKPKLLPHIPVITKSLSQALNISESNVGLTATTLEGLGFVGREEGICVHATATLKKI